jgi:ZIP family zinc transporter
MPSTVAGMLAGAACFAAAAKVVTRAHWHLSDWTEADSRQSILLITTMFVHGIPKGVAIGVGYATGEIRFGLLLAVAIAVHSVPEGTAVSVPLRSRGASVASCAGYAILTSVPQPLLAVPSYLLISVFQPLLAASLGFAGARAWHRARRPTPRGA